MSKEALEQGLEAQAESLRDFGYSSVTANDVRAAHKKWISGETAEGIVEMMCEGAFARYPQIFGKPLTLAKKGMKK